ncbi:hypothetical protein JNK13_00570 [bacterium]|nr:hypothetical protein [bacterium]
MPYTQEPSVWFGRLVQDLQNLNIAITLILVIGAVTIVIAAGKPGGSKEQKIWSLIGAPLLLVGVTWGAHAGLQAKGVETFSWSAITADDRIRIALQSLVLFNVVIAFARSERFRAITPWLVLLGTVVLLFSGGDLRPAWEYFNISNIIGAVSVGMVGIGFGYSNEKTPYWLRVASVGLIIWSLMGGLPYASSIAMIYVFLNIGFFWQAHKAIPKSDWTKHYQMGFYD